MKTKVRCFEDLIAWQNAMDLAVEVYAMTDDGPLVRDFPLRDQMHRAAISVPSNIAEGFERGSRSEFHRFLSIAKGSCAELRTQLMLAQRIGYVDEARVLSTLQRAEGTARIIGRLRTTVARQRLTPLMPHPPCPMPE